MFLLSVTLNKVFVHYGDQIMDRSVLTEEVFRTSGHFPKEQFAENTEVLLRQMKTILAHKPFCRFITPLLDSSSRREVLLLLPQLNGTAMLADGSIDHESSRHYFTKIEIRR